MTSYTKQVDDLLKEAGIVRNTDPARSIALLNQALGISRKNEDRPREVKCHIGIALTHQTSSHFSEALEVLVRALNISIEINNDECISDCYSGFGNTYFYLNDYDRALKYHLDGLKLREKGNDQNRIAFSINSVGVVYATMANFKLAEEYFQRSLDMNTKLNNLFGIRMAMNNIGVASFEQKKYEKAIRILSSALPGSEELLNDTIQTEILTNLGDSYRDSGSPEKAEKYLSIAANILMGRKNIAEARVFMSRARLKMMTSDLESGRELCQKAIALYSELNLKDPLSKAYKLMGEIEHKAGELAKAIVHTQRYIELTDELHKDEMLKKTRNLTLIFEAENLRKESEINYLKNVQLKKAYVEIEQINQNLTDSIQYAKHFQDVIFHKHIQALKDRFPDAFVFSSPKDIVSGDFVWFHSGKGFSIVAVADCTGHGVPGAFLSMLGNDLLNKAVVEQGIRSPDKIMDFLHNSVKDYFPDKEIVPKQGMDVLIVQVNDNGTIAWSGARGYGWLIGEGEFPKEMRGDKIFLGSTLNHEYSLWEAKISKGDSVFLSTDGIIDQKGGGANKGKFSNKRLRAILEKEPASERLAARLAKSFEEWKNGQFQVDDVMVAGLKF